jgi:hypothetical protein
MRSAEALTAALLAPLAQGRGTRIGTVGLTGSGKSWALRELVKRAAPALDVAIVHDDTEDAGKWGGQLRTDLVHVRDRPLVTREESGSPVVVLTGNPFARVYADPEASAAEAWRLAARGWKTAVVLDELKRGTDGQRWKTGPTGDLPRIFTEGRKSGVSSFWATQSPQEIPREAFSQSELLIFLLDGREAEYLRRIGVVDDAQAEKLPRLRNGEFMVRLLSQPRATEIFRY